MLGLDEAKQLIWRQNENREGSQERRQRALEQELRNHAITVEPDCGRDISNVLAQMGRPLTCEQVKERLKKCNYRFHFEVANADHTKTGIYLLPEKKFICGMESGVMPEFTVIHKAKTKVANPDLLGKDVKREVPWKEVDTYVDQTRGWRTVLARLLHAKLITRSDVETYFGWNPSVESKRWHDQTDGSDPSIYQ